MLEICNSIIMQPNSAESISTDTEKNEQYIRLLCSICADVCHRGVRLSCCNIQACRGCATKEITRSRKCWRCEAAHSTKNLINDEHLRIKVQEYKKMAPTETRGRNNVRKSAVDLTTSATPAMSRSKSKTKLSTQSACQLPRKNEPGTRARSKSSTRLATADEETCNGFLNGDESTTPVRRPSQSRNSPPRNKSQSRNSPPRNKSQSRNSPPRNKSQSRNSPPRNRSQSRTRLKRSDSVSSEIGGVGLAQRVVNDENLAPVGGTGQHMTDTPKTLSRFTGRSRLKKFVDSPSSSDKRFSNLDVITLENTQKNAETEVLDTPTVVVDTPSTVMSSAVPHTTNGFYITPKTFGRKLKGGNNRRVCWSAVNVFYFNRTQGFCSVPREGGNTLGMETKHNSSTTLSIQDQEDHGDLHVKRKLFSATLEDQSPAVTQQLSAVRLQPVTVDPKVTSSTSVLHEVHSCPANMEANFRVSVDEEDEEISFKNLKFTVPTAPQAASDDGEIVFKLGEPSTEESPPSVYHTPPEAPDTNPIPNTNLSSTTNLIAKLVPEKSSSPFKRSLSRSYSEDRLSISPNATRRKSTNQDPPRKAHKPCNRITNSVAEVIADNFEDSSPSETQDSNQNLVTADLVTGKTGQPPVIDSTSVVPPSDTSGTSSDTSSSSGYKSEDSASTTEVTDNGMVNGFSAVGNGCSAGGEPNADLPAVRAVTLRSANDPATPEKSGTAMIISPLKASPILVSKSKAKVGRITKSTTKADLFKRSTLKSVYDRGLMRLTRSSVDLKQETVEIPGSSKLFEKPDKKLVKSISRSCLRSFREYHTSPEMQNSRSREEVSSAQFPMLGAVQEKSGEDSAEKSWKLGECGTRGLTPLSNRARVCLLRGNGVNILDKTEAEEAKLIRESREKCGCSCKGVCVPEVCECIQNEIECQVERPGFPCGCTQKVCGNPNGRRFYDRTEIQLHYIQSMMNLTGALNISGSQESLES